MISLREDNRYEMKTRRTELRSSPEDPRSPARRRRLRLWHRTVSSATGLRTGKSGRHFVLPPAYEFLPSRVIVLTSGCSGADRQGFYTGKDTPRSEFAHTAGCGGSRSSTRAGDRKSKPAAPALRHSLNGSAARSVCWFR